MTEPPEDRIYPNGIDGLTGRYLIEPISTAELATWERRPEDVDTSQWVRLAWTNAKQDHLGLPFDVDPQNLGRAGWGVVVSTADTTGVLDELAPLLRHREEQAGERFKILDHLPGETWLGWLERRRVGPGSINPENVPYYLLLAGPPGLIPFSFQYLLAVEYAVGRLHFDDAAGYRRYAESVVDYEQAGAPRHDDTAVFFGTRHDFDRATQLSADRLVRPLVDSFGPGGRYERVGGGRTRTVLGESATKQSLAEVFGGDGPQGRPALLFAAAHGLGGWPPGHPDQHARHGALVCQDWPGFGRIDATHSYGAADLPADARVHGLIAFLFACYGAGTPHLDPFTSKRGCEPPAVADEPFVAALPQQLLAHPGGGALAVIGHVDRAWGYSYLFGGEAQLVPFQNAIGRILIGNRVGVAMKDFSERHGALSANFSDVLQEVHRGRGVPDGRIAALWTERSDAQNYVVLGDPAVASRRT
ncbi:hypothetical protein [Actinoplanes aureus]|uniref:Gingipain domain-containing protein n=1 Tax=Actinoplanes aureus TaxID=2792083 RepID=A0A931G357_9ACTN|nr:hypothetical protein [Actinoplanes aureus]MBG0566716.1 hypothetical protein [Actinoplanes aureus]